jgi:hypothetical protein
LPSRGHRKTRNDTKITLSQLQQQQQQHHKISSPPSPPPFCHRHRRHLKLVSCHYFCSNHCSGRAITFAAATTAGHSAKTAIKAVPNLKNLKNFVKFGAANRRLA